MDALLLVEDPVEEGTRVIGDMDGVGGVDGGVERELHALDQVEDYCIFETAVVLADGKLVLYCGGGGGCVNISW